MNQLLKKGQTVQTVKLPAVWETLDYIGGGGQGEVYRVASGNRKAALKWYFPRSATKEQHGILESLVEKGPPNNSFLWPIDIAGSNRSDGFGYLMPLREERYKSIVDLMKRRIDPTFRTLLTAGFGIADSFLSLHSKGLSYRDISFGNIFFDPDTGEALICDNDNVTIDGASPTGVIGTPRFMAPEIVRNEASPSRYTDLFSLSVLLFYMLFIHHPLEGKKEFTIKCLDLAAMNRLYGTEPVFVFDPDNKSNEPVAGVHDNALLFWSIYPESIKKLFTQAFTSGLIDPVNGRVAESVWRSALIEVRDQLMYCTSCGAENFLDTSKSDIGLPHRCWHCNSDIPLPPALRFGSSPLLLNYDTELFPHHLGDLYDFSIALGRVTRHPQNPGVWGLQNLSSETWQLTTSAGKSLEVPPGKTAGIAYGSTIDFGPAAGAITSLT